MVKGKGSASPLPQVPHWCHGNRAPCSYIKGADTLDVWFDSGASWAAAWPDSTDEAPDSHPEYFGPLGRPADVVLEGSDQHRYAYIVALPLLLSPPSHPAAAMASQRLVPVLTAY